MDESLENVQLTITHYTETRIKQDVHDSQV